MLVDSHCHLDKLDYENIHLNVEDVVKKAKERGVDYLLSVGVTLDSFKPMLEMVTPFENVFVSCGVHPLDLENGLNIDQFHSLAAHPRVVAIGETGLDYHYQTDEDATLTINSELFAFKPKLFVICNIK